MKVVAAVVSLFLLQVISAEDTFQMPNGQEIMVQMMGQGKQMFTMAGQMIEKAMKVPDSDQFVVMLDKADDICYVVSMMDEKSSGMMNSFMQMLNIKFMNYMVDEMSAVKPDVKEMCEKMVGKGKEIVQLIPKVKTGFMSAFTSMAENMFGGMKKRSIFDMTDKIFIKMGDLINVISF